MVYSDVFQLFLFSTNQSKAFQERVVVFLGNVINILPYKCPVKWRGLEAEIEGGVRDVAADKESAETYSYRVQGEKRPGYEHQQ